MAVPGTFLLIDLLKTGAGNKYGLNIGKKVVIAESGKLTADAVKTCKALGADKVSVVFKNEKATAGLDEAEINALEADGVTVLFDSTITGIAGKGDHLTGITINGDTAIDADTLVLESGRLPELVFSLPKAGTGDETENEAEKPKPPADQLEWVAAASYKNPDAGLSNGLLTPGDVITDFSAAIRAIGGGRRGAATIHKILYDMDLELPDHTLTRQTNVQNVDHVENVRSSARQIMPLNHISDIPAHAPELEKGFTEPMAIAEANRCLRCGLICYSDQTVKIRETS